MKVLCADDDPNARTVYEGLFKIMPDDDITVVNSGEEAIAAVEKNHYDVVISDLQMEEEMSGIEVLRFVKKTSLNTDVLIVTGFGSIDTAVEAMRIGARDFIEKPINIKLLIEKIENIRDYQQRILEIEEYRQAKETVEEQAGREAHELERRLQKMQAAINEALTLLEQPEQPTPTVTIDQIIKKLTPFKL